MNDWLGSLILIAFAAGLAGLLVRDVRRATRWARWAAFGLTAASLPLLWPGAYVQSERCFVWFPEAGCAALEAHAPGTYLVVVTFGVLALAQMRHADLPPPDRLRRWQTALSFVLAGLTAAAVTINHFFVRYTLLELAGLTTLVLLALVRARLDHAFWRNALVFRLADGALLLMILGLFFSMGTFHIETLLSGAATLPRARLWLVAGGGLLAAWVKLALPPFAGWARDARQSPSASLVAVGSGLPLLGAYLLYRLVPLWAALGLELLLMALGLALLAFAVLVHGRSLSERGLLAVDALAVGLAVTPLMPAYLVLFVPLRVALLWYRPAEAELPETASAAVLLRTTLSGAARTMAFVETGLLNRFSRRLTTGTRRVSEGLQALHRGNLGQNMMWICAGLGLLLVMALMLLPIG